MIKINDKNLLPHQTVYLSGPMTGLPDYNRGAFNLREEAFKAKGINVLNPARISEKAGTQHEYEWYLKRALRLMLEADVLYVFGDVTHSRGVDVELRLARELKMPVVFESERSVVYG